MRTQIIDGKFLPGERRRLDRKRLRGPRLFSRHLRFWDGTLFDRPQRLSCHAIEYPDESLLADLRHNIDRLAFMANRQKFGRSRVVVIPDIVMNHLEMPQTFSGPGVQRQQTIAEEVRPAAVRAVEVILRACSWRVNNTPLLIDGKLAPHIRSADAFPGVLRPSVITEFTRTGNRMKGPDQFARPYIKGANIARGRSVSLVRCGTENQKILKYPSRSRRLDQADRCRVAIQALFEIDTPILPKRVDRLARARIDRAEKVIAGEKEPSVVSVLALPIIDAAVRDYLGIRLRSMRPDFFARRRVERHNGVVFGKNIDRSTGHKRIEEVLVVIPGRVFPRDFQLMDIRLVDLLQRGVLRSIRGSAVIGPCRMVLAKQGERQ